ncbi:hypothetical protein AB1Y20_021884 [Prymnesium parvum]|uniref:HhH-GPD domain-containing protein n=1 Tax=Prymnesium parvum TaxID=97485 RepID=A0AB34JGS7_PRYPA
MASDFDFSQFAFSPPSFSAPPAERSEAPPPFESSSTAVEPSARLAACAVHDVKLSELSLIRSFRMVTHASVDEFHSFLLSLSTSPHGKFWALVACLLSVQCRDAVALEATRGLMHAAPRGPADVAALAHDELLSRVRSCNYCVTKAKNVRAASEAVVRSGRVAVSHEALLALPGVGAKIAHLMRSLAFADDGAGIVVDTHVHRIAAKLGWVDEAAARAGPEATRRALQLWVPRGEWASFSLAVVGFGQVSREGTSWGSRFISHVERNHKTLGVAHDDAVELARSIVHRIDSPLAECERPRKIARQAKISFSHVPLS